MKFFKNNEEKDEFINQLLIFILVLSIAILLTDLKTRSELPLNNDEFKHNSNIIQYSESGGL